MREAKNINEHSPWQELTPGAEIYEPGTSRLVNTGEWRVLTPFFDQDKCRQVHSLLQLYFIDLEAFVQSPQVGELLTNKYIVTKK